MPDTDGTNAKSPSNKEQLGKSRSRSRRRTVTDAGQTNNGSNNANKEETSSTENTSKNNKRPDNATSGDHNHLAIPIITSDPPSPEDESNKTNHVSFNPSSPNRPTADGVAFPFKLSSHLVENARNASTVTLESQAGVVTPKGDEAGKQLGESTGNETQGVSKTETDEMSKETADEEGRHTANGAGSQNIHTHTPDETVKADGEGGGPTESRRRTLEDAKGVLHHGIASSSSASG